MKVEHMENDSSKFKSLLLKNKSQKESIASKKQELSSKVNLQNKKKKGERAQ